MIFNNKRFLKKQSLQILRSGVKVDKKTLFDSIEYEISFEKIHNKLKIQTTVNHGLLIISFFLITTGFIILASGNDTVAMVFFTLTLIAIIIAFATILKTVTIVSYDNDNIELYYTKSNKSQVIEFANQIINSSNSYLLKKYGKIDKALPIES